MGFYCLAPPPTKAAGGEFFILLSWQSLTSSQFFKNFNMPNQVVVQHIEERLSALGNCIACNDYIALTHTDLDKMHLELSLLLDLKAELIAFVEHTLARISSSHLISNGGSSSFTDPHSGSIPTTVEMVELVGPRSSQHGKQLSSSLPVQQIHQGLLGDRHKAHSTSGIFSKPILPPGNSSNVSLSDIPNPRKACNIHLLWFGYALNIETLVAV
ncbi:Eukaryotic translation initiation factor 6-2 [Camellia lanceoleosa]|nr:Eukaryotic translation initiation factor 6-2 [Camellia lanceoleosa]